MTKVFVPFVSKDESSLYPEGWNGESEVFVIIYAHEEKSEREMTSTELMRLAEKGGSFDFLSDPREDIYSVTDGESAK